MSLQGKKALDDISSYNVDKVFLSCKGIDLEKGITDGNDETAGVKQNMLKAAGKVYLAVDSTKFEKTALSRICGLSETDVIVTDVKPEKHWLETFDKLGVTCLWG